MGCENTKEKIEKEMMSAQMEKFKVQYEKYKQLKLLENMLGHQVFRPSVPDYIVPKSPENKKNLIDDSFICLNKREINLRKNYHKRGKSCKINSLEEDKREIIKLKDKKETHIIQRARANSSSEGNKNKFNRSNNLINMQKNKSEDKKDGKN